MQIYFGRIGRLKTYFLKYIIMHAISSSDWWPAITLSSGTSNEEHCGKTRANTLYAPINDFIQPTDSRLQQDEGRTGGSRVPDQPKISVDLRMITVTTSRWLQFKWGSSTLLHSRGCQQSWRQYSSFLNRSPRTGHISSFRVVSEPSVPITGWT